jgi:hypothetical protein
MDSGEKIALASVIIAVVSLIAFIAHAMLAPSPLPVTPTPVSTSTTPVSTPTTQIKTTSISTPVPASGYVEVSGINYGSTQDVDLYIDDILYDSEYTYSGSSYDFGEVELSEGPHTIEVYGRLDKTSDSDSWYTTPGGYAQVSLDLPPVPLDLPPVPLYLPPVFDYAYVEVSGVNYGSTQDVDLYIDDILYDSEYTYSGSSYDFGEVELSGGPHTIEVYGRLDKTSDSISGYTIPGGYAQVSLNIPRF